MNTEKHTDSKSPKIEAFDLYIKPSLAQNHIDNADSKDQIYCQWNFRQTRKLPTILQRCSREKEGREKERKYVCVREREREAKKRPGKEALLCRSHFLSEYLSKETGA